MQVYLYAKSGHSIGLDATRRCAAIAAHLEEFDPILCTSDFRAGAYAKEHLGIKKYVSVDVLSNLPNIMRKGDILIYDSDEASEFMEKQMQNFCSILYKIGTDIPLNIINETIFKKQNASTTASKTLFFGEDDYNNLFLALCQNSSKQEIDTLMGHYFFLGNEKKLTPYFNAVLEEEEYIQTIQHTQYLLSGSVNACLESLYCGNSPVFCQRDDKAHENIEILTSLNIPSIKANTLEELVKKFDAIIENYPQLSHFEVADVTSVYANIRKMFDRYNKVMNKK